MNNLDNIKDWGVNINNSESTSAGLGQEAGIINQKEGIVSQNEGILKKLKNWFFAKFGQGTPREGLGKLANERTKDSRRAEITKNSKEQRDATSSKLFKWLGTQWNEKTPPEVKETAESILSLIPFVSGFTDVYKGQKKQQGAFIEGFSALREGDAERLKAQFGNWAKGFVQEYWGRLQTVADIVPGETLAKYPVLKFVKGKVGGDKVVGDVGNMLINASKSAKPEAGNILGQIGAWFNGFTSEHPQAISLLGDWLDGAVKPLRQGTFGNEGRKESQVATGA